MNAGFSPGVRNSMELPMSGKASPVGLRSERKVRLEGCEAKTV
jgi:hypothetical protein